MTAKPKTPRRILVIGGGYSGIDIANELASVFPSIVHAAPGSESRQAPGEGGRRKNIEVRGRVVCLSDLGKDVTKSYVVYFDDGSLEWGIDHIVLATGYVLNFRFLKDLERIDLGGKEPGKGKGSGCEVFEDGTGLRDRDDLNKGLATNASSTSAIPSTAVTTTNTTAAKSTSTITLPNKLTASPFHILPLAHHLFPVTSPSSPSSTSLSSSSTPDFPPSSLAIVGLPLKVAPFPLFEAQARAVGKVFGEPGLVDGVAEREKARREMQRRLDGIVGRGQDQEQERNKNTNTNINTNKDDETDEDALERVAHAWHVFSGNEQFEYRDWLHSFAGLSLEGTIDGTHDYRIVGEGESGTPTSELFYHPDAHPHSHSHSPNPTTPPTHSDHAHQTQG